MTPRVTLRKALEDSALLGGVLGGDTWHTWRSILLAAMGEPLQPDELDALSSSPEVGHSNRVDELWCCVGRRGGKSRAMEALAVYLAGPCDYSEKLSPGERGVVLLLAPDMKQAKVLFDYAEGTLESTPIMKQLLQSRTAETLTLTTGIELSVRSASFRRIRGVTCVAVLADECAFWMSDESANPDVETLNAARPALATTQGPLIAISSPYARRGALWETYRKHFGPDGDQPSWSPKERVESSIPTCLSQSSTRRWIAIPLLPVQNTWRSSGPTLRPSSRVPIARVIASELPPEGSTNA